MLKQFLEVALAPLFISDKTFPLNKKNIDIAEIVAPIGDNIIVIKSVKELNLSILVAKGKANTKHKAEINIDAFFSTNLSNR